jgi:hypothetical protein
MPSVPAQLPWSSALTSDLVSQATAVLVREMSRLPGRSLELPGQLPSASGAEAANEKQGIPYLAGRTCPVTGSAVPLGGSDRYRLGPQAYELVATLLSQLGQTAGSHDSPMPPSDASGVMPLATTVGTEIHELAGRICPVTGAAVPFAMPDRDRLRRQAHEFIEALLVTFSQATGEKAAPYEDQVPLIQCVAPVRAGNEAMATMRVANDEATPSEVALYCTNFVADSGYEIPSLRVTVLPRRVTIPPRGQADFEIKIAVSQQTPAGIYSGLIQAMGSKYVKAVLSVEVL